MSNQFELILVNAMMTNLNCSVSCLHSIGDEDVDVFLENMEIEATGITHPPVPSNFHPSEAEATHRNSNHAGGKSTCGG